MGYGYRGGSLELSDSDAAARYRMEHVNDFAYMKAMPAAVVRGIWNAPEMEMKKMLELFKSFNPDRTSIDELIALLTFGRAFAATYDEFGDAPEFVGKQVAALEKAITFRMESELENRLAQIRLQREALKTTEEKRRSLATEEQQIIAKLGRQESRAASKK